LLEDSIAVARELRGDAGLGTALSNIGLVEIDAGNLERAMEVLQEALMPDRKLGDAWGAAIDQLSLAAASLRAGRARKAPDLLSSILDDVVGSGDIELLANTLGVGCRSCRAPRRRPTGGPPRRRCGRHPEEGGHADSRARRGPA
jgi:tetratricopeptide (TPR) repeat protein